MYARISRSEHPPATADRLAAELRSGTVPAVARSEGFLHGAWVSEVDEDEVVTLVLLDAHAGEIDLGTGPVERWDVLAFAGVLGGGWCLVHPLDGEALPNVIQTAVDRAVASAGTVGAVGLVHPDGRSGAVYAFSEPRPPEGHGGRLYRVLATA